MEARDGKGAQASFRRIITCNLQLGAQAYRHFQRAQISRFPVQHVQTGTRETDPPCGTVQSSLERNYVHILLTEIQKELYSGFAQTLMESCLGVSNNDGSPWRIEPRSPRI